MSDSMKALSGVYKVQFNDGSVWAVSMSDLIIKHAEQQMGQDLVEVIETITIPFLTDDKEGFIKWIQQNVTWEMVKASAVMLASPQSYKTYAAEFLNPSRAEIQNV